MSMKRAIERIALADARRFEERMRGLQEKILEKCDDAATRRILKDLIAEEDEHLRRLDQVSAPESRSKIEKRPELRGRTVREMLTEILEMEKAAVAFYDLLAERTAVPAFRELFRGLAAAERRHEACLAEHVRNVLPSSPWQKSFGLRAVL